MQNEQVMQFVFQFAGFRADRLLDQGWLLVSSSLPLSDLDLLESSINLVLVCSLQNLFAAQFCFKQAHTHTPVHTLCV